MVGRPGNETSDCDCLYHSRAVVDCYSIMHVCVWNALQQTRMSTVQYTHCKLPHKACLLPDAMIHIILIMYIPKQVGFFLVDCFQFRLQYHMERKGWGSTPYSQLLHVYMECDVYGVWCIWSVVYSETVYNGHHGTTTLGGFTVAKNNILAIYKN